MQAEVPTKQMYLQQFMENAHRVFSSNYPVNYSQLTSLTATNRKFAEQKWVDEILPDGKTVRFWLTMELLFGLSNSTEEQIILESKQNLKSLLNSDFLIQLEKDLLYPAINKSGKTKIATEKQYQCLATIMWNDQFGLELNASKLYQLIRDGFERTFYRSTNWEDPEGITNQMEAGVFEDLYIKAYEEATEQPESLDLIIDKWIGWTINANWDSMQLPKFLKIAFDKKWKISSQVEKGQNYDFLLNKRTPAWWIYNGTRDEIKRMILTMTLNGELPEVTITEKAEKTRI